MNIKLLLSLGFLLTAPMAVLAYDWNVVNPSAYSVIVEIEGKDSCTKHTWNLAPGSQGPSKSVAGCCVGEVKVYLANPDSSQGQQVGSHSTFSCGSKTYAVAPQDPNNPQGAWNIEG
jgi:hypothetical protein